MERASKGGRPTKEDRQGVGETESGWKEREGDLLSWKPREDRVSRRGVSAVLLKAPKKGLSHDLWFSFQA